ncbi:MAG TPA: L,D-transpeptidase family protein [Blastocatellia bacterium]|jgi:hypothetical protein|nr:L,D-transpeptidase family protein [Blastocatellia bacterium]
MGKRTVSDVIREAGPRAAARLRPYFSDAGVDYPPGRVALLGFKQERRLELWADRDGAWVHIRAYPIYGASGVPGPKLREGDLQVPEGVYRITALNPNSSYHLSMKLNYPNRHDVERARAENRDDPGGNIFIHGKDSSVGCLAIGDEAIEELFSLVSITGPTNVSVIIAPNDLRSHPPVTGPGDRPAWVAPLYDAIGQELKPFKRS